MMNAAMMIAPAPQTGNTPSGVKAAAGQGQLFGQAMAQQQQGVYQTTEQDQPGLSGLPGKGILSNNFSEMLAKDTSAFFALQPQPQPQQLDLLEQLEQLDMELLDGLALLFEQGVVPNSMDHAQLQQLVDLVEEVLPGWQFHNQVVAEKHNEQGLLSEQGDLEPGRNELALAQKVEELIAWFRQYQEQPLPQEQAQQHPGKGITGELPPGQLVAAQKLEQVRERLLQLRANLPETGTKADSNRTEGEAKGNHMVTVAMRGTEMAARQELPESALETRFSELLKPRQPQVGQPQPAENGRQVQQVQKAQQVQQVPHAPTNQPPAEESVEAIFAKVVDKSAPQVPLAQAAMSARPGIEGLTQQHNPLHAQPSPVAVAAQAITAAPAMATPFAAGQQIADSQIFAQVVTHLSGSDKGDMGRMVLRLHPAELGSLRIELMVEGDKVRANLHAQTQQVQEVLERNLGQLRNALAEQGLKIDHFQVSSDARQNQQQGQAEDLTHQRQQAEQSARNKRDKEEQLPEDRTIPLAHLIQNGGRGISLHV